MTPWHALPWAYEAKPIMLAALESIMFLKAASLKLAVGCAS